MLASSQILDVIQPAVSKTTTCAPDIPLAVGRVQDAVHTGLVAVEQLERDVTVFANLHGHSG